MASTNTHTERESSNIVTKTTSSQRRRQPARRFASMAQRKYALVRTQRLAGPTLAHLCTGELPRSEQQLPCCWPLLALHCQRRSELPCALLAVLALIARSVACAAAAAVAAVCTRADCPQHSNRRVRPAPPERRPAAAVPHCAPFCASRSPGCLAAVAPMAATAT